MLIRGLGIAAVGAAVTVASFAAAAAAAPVTPAGVASVAGTYVPLAPTRIMDTRHGLGSTAPPAFGSTSLQVAGQGGVPSSGVSAVVLTVTVAVARASGVLTVYPAGAARPATSNLNFAAGQPVANQVVLPLGAGGRIVFANHASATTELVADVSGYYRGGESSVAGSYVPVAPTRIADTRTGLGSAAAPRFAAINLQVSGRGGVPASGASAVVLNVTATRSQRSGVLTVYPSGAARPATSTLNFGSGVTVPNLAVTKLGDDGRVSLYNYSSGTTQLVIDVLGYYRAGTPTATGSYVAVDPVRVVDSRTKLGLAPLGPNDDGTLKATGFRIAPADAAAVALNVTVAAPTAVGYLAVGASSVPPTTSSVNVQPAVTRANSVFVRPAHATFYNRTGRVQVVGDIAGYFLGHDRTGGSIAGRVTAAAGGAPVGSVYVDVYSSAPAGGDQFPVSSTWTDSDGRYAATDVPSGSYYVCIGTDVVGQPQTYAGRCFQDAAWCGDACAPPMTSTVVPVADDAVEVVDVRLALV